MENELLSYFKTFLSGGAGAAFATGLYKLFFRLLDTKDKTKEQKDDRVVELEKQLIPLAQQAAALPWCQQRCDELRQEKVDLEKKYQIELDELRTEYRGRLADAEKTSEEFRIKWVQSETVVTGYKALAEFFNNPEGHKFLRDKMMETQNNHERQQHEPQQQRDDTTDISRSYTPDGV